MVQGNSGPKIFHHNLQFRWIGPSKRFTKLIPGFSNFLLKSFV